ncbi:MAG TPA: element excision factor XisH family protein [Armatimonadota bacterium]|nr:element excision factor XisH family protein [Armatimonadota bacterium]
MIMGRGGRTLPARDSFHNAVRAALEKDGWVITDDPLLIRFGRRNVFVDLGAERPLAAERDGRRIAVEVKSFTGPSDVTELERALGQYRLYSFILPRRDPGRICTSR